MRYSAIIVTQAALLCALAAAAADVNGKDKRQVGLAPAAKLDTEEDREVSASAFASAGGLGSGKYFQYAHVPAKDHYEFGHRRGNEHHFIERHEKAHPHAGEFKTKVRWGDKHGGYGEHYWDYNHDGHGVHHGDDGEETKDEPQYTAYEEAEDKTKYVAGRAKREPNPNEDVEFIDEKARLMAASGLGGEGKHGGNYRWDAAVERAKRTPELVDVRDVVYDPQSGLMVDTKTGQAYTLTPVA